MAGVITGKARSTEGCRLSLDDPVVMRGIKKTRNNAGLVDLAEVNASRKVCNRTAEQRAKVREDKARMERRAAKRRAQWEAKKAARREAR